MFIPGHYIITPTRYELMNTDSQFVSSMYSVTTRWRDSQIYRSRTQTISDIPYCLVVRIPAFHAGGPGSIPGVGNSNF